jgi:hypothetical protein
MKKKFKICKRITKPQASLLGLSDCSYEKGDSIELECDVNGIPKDKFWRKRLDESKKDGCIEAVKSNKKESSSVDKKVDNKNKDKG